MKTPFEIERAEEWRPVLGYECVYSVSNFGRVRRELASRGARAGHILAARLDKETGYFRVNLVHHSTETSYSVHRLVAAAFLGPCPAGLCVNHKDGVKTNNSPTNLEYMTLAENNAHAALMGLTAKKTHCIAGHELTGRNAKQRLRHGKIGRECRKCLRRRNTEYRRRKRLGQEKSAKKTS